MGLGYIATNLKENGVGVKLIDAVAENLLVTEILEKIEKEKPRFVGLNIFTTNFGIIKRIIEKCRTKTHFIIGGKTTKFTSKEIIGFKTKNKLDVVIGDGELIVLDIVLEKIKEKPLFNGYNRRVFVINGTSKYFVKDISKIPLDRTFFNNGLVLNPFGLREAHIVTSRGCIYNCAFCGAARNLNLDCPVRLASQESIYGEVMNLKLRYSNLECIRVLDDLFLKDRRRMEEVVEIFSKVKLFWRAMVNVRPFNGIGRRTLEAMKESGCLEFFTGIESGSERILKMIDKYQPISFVKKKIKEMLDVGINIKGYFMYGFPNEKELDFNKTYDLAEELIAYSFKTEGKFRTSVFQFRPYHGTKLYNDVCSDRNALNMKIHKKLNNAIGRDQYNFYTKNFSDADDQTLTNFIIKTHDLNAG